MTALKEFERLECTALWRPSAEAQRRDVIVSLGDATLTIADGAGRALAHWSLPAVRRLNPGSRPALFAPDADSGETLEIDDALMIDAMMRVRRAIERRRPRPGRLRLLLLVVALAALTALAAFWLPGAMIAYTASVVPAGQRAEIGGQLLAGIRRIAGEPCDDPLGLQALDKLQARLFGAQAGRIVVLPGGGKLAAHLPGHIILLRRDLVEDYDTPEVAAGFALVEDLRLRAQDPLRRLLAEAGLGAAFRLLTTGQITGATLTRHAETLMLSPSHPVPTGEIIAGFAQARLPLGPYARALDVTGETTLELIEADALLEQDSTPVLADDDWVSLQGICGE